MLVDYYRKPDGRIIKIDMTEITDEDHNFFIDNEYIISMEDVSIDHEENFAVYGRPEDCDEEDEILVLSQGRNCYDTMSELREKCEKYFK